MTENYYDSQRGASEYLLFHYGAKDLTPPPGWSEPGAPEFPARCVAQGLDCSRLPADARALDLGCAVGRSSFELARHCAQVIGVDFSEQFIDLARQLQKRGLLKFHSFEEGDLTKPRRAVVPPDIDRRRVRFEVGDATQLRTDLGEFDVVLAANLIDRLNAPLKFLARLPKLLRPGGQLIVTSPYTWLPGYTPRRNWLGGFARRGRPVRTFESLRRVLERDFEFVRKGDVPFLLREHARKYQLGVAELSAWVRG
jgi:putative 4-mercaptohistidine N1-methyltranferase